MYSNIMQKECCICFNDIDTESIFDLECCNNVVHQDCIELWLKSSIDNQFTDYNKCILCKRYNKNIDEIYKQIRKTIKDERNSERVIIVIDREDNYVIGNNSIDHIEPRYRYRFLMCKKFVVCCSNSLYFMIALFCSYIVLDIFIKLSHI